MRNKDTILLEEAYEKVLKENEGFHLDRFGSHPDRPKDVRFKNKEDYNSHMGFDASLPDDLDVPEIQRKKVEELIKQGFKVRGHSKLTGVEPFKDNQVEIMLSRTGGPNTSRFGIETKDVFPDGTTT